MLRDELGMALGDALGLVLRVELGGPSIGEVVLGPAMGDTLGPLLGRKPVLLVFTVGPMLGEPIMGPILGAFN